MSKDNNKISMSSTICANCTFAEYDKKTQTGCKANRLELFKKHNIPMMVSEVEGHKTFIIEGKVCVYYRNETWAKEHYKTKDIDKILSLVKKELQIPYHAIVFFRENDSIEDVKNRLTELQNQTVKPKIVTLVDKCSFTTKSNTADLMKTLQEYDFAYWRVQTVQLAEQIDNDIIDLVYDSTKNNKYMFYVCFECSHQIPDSFSQEIHRSLQDEMKAFTVLLPNENNVGKTVLKIAHKKYGGNSFAIPLEEKIKHYDDATFLIKKVEEICPSLNLS